MKRIFLYAMMAAGVLASCSQNESDLPEGGSGNSKPDADAILISAVSPSVSVNVTRSSGTIGADGTNLNTGWSGQELYVFGYRKENGVAQITTNSSDWVFSNQYQKAMANAGTVNANSTTLEWMNEAGNEAVRLYYPRSNYFDFFGYYADEASKVEDVVTANGTSSVPFTITGSEDLMIAKTTPSSDAVPAERLFGSYAARHGVQPVMTFEHQLTRLVFKVATPVPNNPAAPTDTELKNIADAKNVYIKSIEINSKTTGNLIFASTAANTDPLSWTSETKTFLPLKERNNGVMQDLNTGITIPTTLPETNAGLTDVLGKYPAAEGGTLVGEALLVEPDASEYEMRVTVMQYYDGDGNLIPEKQREYVYPLENTKLLATSIVNGESSTTFKRSHSYNITITVYGVQKIEITAELGDWTFGGDVPVDPEK